MVKKDEQEIIDLAKEIASKSLDDVMEHLTKKTDIAYVCNQNKFDCAKKYNCKAPDECTLDFKCSNEHTVIS